MGVRNLKLQNNNLLNKWLWRYAEESSALWKNVIQQKYGQNGQLMSPLTPMELDYGGQSSLSGPTWARTLLSKLAIAKKNLLLEV